MKKTIAVAWLLASASLAQAETPDSVAGEKTDFRPHIHGTVRAKYEYEPGEDMGRFEVRNARVSVEGNALRWLSYKAEIDLSDEGQIKMLDAYARAQAARGFDFTIGQMRVPFTIDAHRSPHQQYFANRSFIAKQVGNVRDVGATVSWRHPGEVSVSLQGGVFNGSGLTGQKNFWTRSYNYSLKGVVEVGDRVNVTVGCQRARPGHVSVHMWDAGAWWDDGLWHVEGEYLRKHYSHGAFKAVNAVNVFAVRRWPLRRVFSGISALARYDCMSDHSNGIQDDKGVLVTDDPGRHRITGGVTLSMGSKAKSEIRLNYEKYFYAEGVKAGVSDHDKIVLEVMCRF